MTAAPALTHSERRWRHWCTAAAMTASIQVSPLSSYAVLQVVEITHAPSLAVCSALCSQLDWNPANFEATIEVEWILNSLSSCENGIFQWRHNYVIITYCRASIGKTFFTILVTWNARMIRAKNYENMAKFVKVTAKILSVPFFRTRYIFPVLSLLQCHDVTVLPWQHHGKTLRDVVIKLLE